MTSSKTAKTVVTIAIVLVFLLLLGIAGGMDKADAAVPPITDQQARGAVTRYLEHEQAIGESTGGRIKRCQRADQFTIRCNVVEYGVDLIGFGEGDLSYRIDVVRVDGVLQLTSSLFGPID